MRGGGSRTGPAVFSRRNLRRVDRIKLGEDQYGHRDVVCGLQEGRRVRLCSAHLTPGDGKARKQMTRVLKNLEKWWNEKGDTVVLAGDLNLTADDHGLNKVYAPGASTRCTSRTRRGSISTPPLASAPYARASWRGVTDSS